jgi:hypothetical protein
MNRQNNSVQWRAVLRSAKSGAHCFVWFMAERGGFEPPRPLQVYTLSKRAH